MNNGSMIDSMLDSVLKRRSEPTETATRYIASLGDDLKPRQDIPPDPGSGNVPGVGSGLRDSAGTLFDPSIHSTDDNGKPIETKTGKWRKKRGPKTGQRQTVDPADANQQRNALSAGYMTAQMIFLTCQTVFGNEWVPVKSKEHGIDEEKNMVDAWTAYYLQTGTQEPPAWVVVCIACMGYAAPRLQAPKTKSKLARMWEWAKPFIGLKRKEVK